jgi:methyl-accepting chemotaxis protein
MRWFQADAPIRLKLKIAFGTFVGLIAILGGLSYLIDGSVVALGISAAFVVIGSVIGAWFRKAICDPFVTTVERMESVAAGNLTAPIQFNDYKDCVGRLTRAMLTFRDAAVTQQAQASSQDQVVATVKAHLNALAKGDLTAAITEDFPPAYAELKTNFNEALSELRTLIGSVMESTSSISTGSSEIAHASEHLARRTEANAASLEQTSAALTQIDGRLKATAIAAGNTVQRADQAIATVGGGRAVAEEAVQAMGRVSDSARGIDSVIEGVDKIAFQTRVLAMNAAVEAGRAGDAGRGFAVVADLVSALAMRAEEEAKRARDQLTVTQADIGTAVEAVRKVDGALSNISGDVGEVHQLLGTMAADNRAQSSAISEISTAIGTMDQSTQQNAAMVEETSAAARNLTNEVHALAEHAQHFTIGNDREQRTPGRIKVPA